MLCCCCFLLQDLKNQAYVFSNSLIAASSIQRFGFSSQSNENESVQSDKKVSVKRRRRRASVKRSKFSDDSDSDSDPLYLSRDGLLNLLRNKEKLLNQKQLEMETMKDKALRIFAENEQVIQRTKRETENSKIFAIQVFLSSPAFPFIIFFSLFCLIGHVLQSFAKSLLDVADNLGRASSVVKDRFTKIETTEDPSGALSLLKTLLEGVEMTEKQLAEVTACFFASKAP